MRVEISVARPLGADPATRMPEYEASEVATIGRVHLKMCYPPKLTGWEVSPLYRLKEGSHVG